MTYPGLGGQQPPPQNAAAAAPLLPGVQPGTTAAFVQLKAGNTIINAAGIFTYSGAPAAGNLIFSDAPASGTDPYGNPYLQGATAYIYFSGQQFAASLSTEIASSPAVSFQNMGSAGVLNPAVYGNSQSETGAFNQLVLSSGDATGGGTTSITLEDQSIGGQIAFANATAVTMTGAAVSAQSFTSAGDISVQGSQLFVGNGTTAEVVLNPKQTVNAAATHISTTPTAAEFNSVVDLVNSLRSAMISIGLAS